MTLLIAPSRTIQAHLFVLVTCGRFWLSLTLRLEPTFMVCQTSATFSLWSHIVIIG